MHPTRARDIIVAACLLLTACAPTRASFPMMVGEPADAASESATSTHEPMPIPTAAGSDMPATMSAGDAPSETADANETAGTPDQALPAWMSLALVDVRTGQEFRLGDFREKVVLIEPMAVWCTKCRALQEQIRTLPDQLGEHAADLVVVSMDVDPNEDAAYLAAYVDRAGFDWAFVIAPPALSRALAAEYSDLFLNPPSTPLLVIDREGAAHLLPFGPKTAADILTALLPLMEG